MADGQSSNAPVVFYEKGQPFYGFTNFAPYPVEHDNKTYPTAEHLFQARKFLDARPDLAERIRITPTPRAAHDEATKLRAFQRSDWRRVSITVMEEVLEEKITRHAVLHDMLLSTGDRSIVQGDPDDDFWGAGKDRQGRNEMGKALMRVRQKLRDQAAAPKQPPLPGLVPMTATRPPPKQPLSTVPADEDAPIVPPNPNAQKRALPSVPNSPAKFSPIFSMPPTPTTPAPSPIWFFEKEGPFNEFMNNSPHTVFYNGKMYPSGEHLFQAHKFLKNAPHLAEHIRAQASSRGAWEEATYLRHQQRNDWFDVNIGCMDAVLEAKFTQHAPLHALLLSTGDRELINANPVDGFWGYGPDRHGRNELGKCLMRLRTKLRANGGVDMDGDSDTCIGSDE